MEAGSVKAYLDSQKGHSELPGGSGGASANLFVPVRVRVYLLIAGRVRAYLVIAEGWPPTCWYHFGGKAYLLVVGRVRAFMPMAGRSRA